LFISHISGLLQLTVEQVSDMFCEMNMDQYTQCIKDNAIDGAILAFIDEEGLKLIGVGNAFNYTGQKFLLQLQRKK
jgi:hypothetical protein